MHETPPLDEFDLRLPAALQENGRLTNREVADRVGLSPSQCSRRRAVLEAAGIISGYRAELAAGGAGFPAYRVHPGHACQPHGDNAVKFRKLIADLDGVQESHALTGDTDYLLKAVLADLKSLSALVNDVLLSHEAVARVRSSIVLERLKETARLPLRRLPVRRHGE